MGSSKLELKLWRWQRISALILLPLVAFHIIHQYFVIGIGAISFNSASAKLHVALFLLIDLLLLLSAVVHAFLGLRSVVMDYAPSQAFSKRATAAILGLLAGVVIYGLIALVAFL